MGYAPQLAPMKELKTSKFDNVPSEEIPEGPDLYCSEQKAVSKE